MSVANAGRTTMNAYGAGRSVKLIVAGKTGCRLSLSVNEARRMPALPFAYEAAGASWHPVFPAPSDLEDAKPTANLGRTAPRGDFCCLVGEMRRFASEPLKARSCPLPGFVVIVRRSF